MNRRRSNRAKPRQTSPGKGSRHAASHRGSGGELRIIGGAHRSRRLPVLQSPGLRPTPDRVRETLFNWLAFELPGRRVLDLYAGTGALGLEALSRGVAEAVFVESQAPVATAIEENLARLHLDAQVVRDEVARYLEKAPRPFDLVFLDPPFRQGLAASTCEQLERLGWLSEGALIYVESEPMLEWSPPANWSLHREVRAGDSHGRLFRRLAAGRDDDAR
ncbi:16S rRNA (guanine(966)-N(2))-methyltransferase RsmD [Salinicola aestuarinus]|uniref:16S rRNA (guanine(966)-N(2))-methyltransferase RsmD n=1 Tax=Salinicola aestuarinus TaxID=1949082 RepID=UPI000DA239E3|nr:16S rRNA (guanine(966)-N(2))-methyltransferase RsmD [Salinicola aestuarinus]